jgi:hypothetical protein
MTFGPAESEFFGIVSDKHDLEKSIWKKGLKQTPWPGYKDISEKNR